MAKSRVRRLVNKTQFAPHQFAVGVDTFPKLNLDHISRDLKLVELGQERGAAEEPPQGGVGLDDVEDRVINFIRQKQSEAQASFQEQMEAYTQRLAKCALHSIVGEIEDAAKTASAKIDAEVAKARDLVGELRAAVRSAEGEWTAFCKKHELTRPARYPNGGGAWVLRWGIIATIVLGEAGMNGYFFSQGSDLGWLGGVFEAGLIALFNVAMGLAAGFFPARWIGSRTLWLQGVGLALLAAWFSLSVIFNLVVGHYRSAMEALAPDPAVAAWASFTAGPGRLHSLQAWMLIGVGIAFSTVALADGWSMDDPFPGYGAVDRRLEKAKDTYVFERGDLLDLVQDEYEDGRKALADRASQVGKRRDEGELIRAGVESLRHSYEAHLRYLEESANGLIEIYRDANRKARPPKTTPARFRKRWKHDFPHLPDLPTSAYSQEDLRELTSKAEARRRLGESRLERARESAAAVFPALGEG